MSIYSTKLPASNSVSPDPAHICTRCDPDLARQRHCVAVWEYCTNLKLSVYQ